MDGTILPWILMDSTVFFLRSQCLHGNQLTRSSINEQILLDKELNTEDCWIYGKILSTPSFFVVINLQLIGGGGVCCGGGGRDGAIQHLHRYSSDQYYPLKIYAYSL